MIREAKQEAGCLRETSERLRLGGHTPVAISLTIGAFTLRRSMEGVVKGVAGRLGKLKERLRMVVEPDACSGGGGGGVFAHARGPMSES